MPSKSADFNEAMQLAAQRAKEPLQNLASAGEPAPNPSTNAWQNAISGRATEVDRGNSWFEMLDIAAADEAKATAKAFDAAGKTRCPPDELAAARQRVAAAHDEWRKRASQS